jgi:hypothetical protein
MTALGDAEFSPKAENTKGSREKENHGTGSQPVSAAIRDQPAVASAKPRLFQPGAIKTLFREMKKLLTGEAPAPAPEPQRKRRKEDTSSLFKMARRFLWNTRSAFKHAKEILHRAPQPQAEPPPVALPRNHPSNFDWNMLPDYAHEEHMRVLERHAVDHSQQQTSGFFHYAEHTPLFPRV